MDIYGNNPESNAVLNSLQFVSDNTTDIGSPSKRARTVYAVNSQINNMTCTNLSASSVTSGSVYATTGSISFLTGLAATCTNLTVTTATCTNLNVSNMTCASLAVTSGTIGSFSSSNASVTTMNINNNHVTSQTTTLLNSTSATVTQLNVTTATVGAMTSQSNISTFGLTNFNAMWGGLINMSASTFTDGAFTLTTSESSNLGVSHFWKAWSPFPVGWICAASKYSTSTGLYIGTSTTVVTNLGSVMGEWGQMDAGRPIQFNQTGGYGLSTAVLPGSPKQFYLCGSNDNATWYLIDDRVTTPAPNYISNTLQFFTNNNNPLNTAYRYLRWIITAVGNTGSSPFSSEVSIKQVWIYANNTSTLNPGILQRNVLSCSGGTVPPSDTIFSYHDILLLSTAGGPYSLVFDNGSNMVPGQIWTIKDSDGNANFSNIVLNPNTGTIDGATSYTISTAYGHVRITTDGTNYFTI